MFDCSYLVEPLTPKVEDLETGNDKISYIELQ